MTRDWARNGDWSGNGDWANMLTTSATGEATAPHASPHPSGESTAPNFASESTTTLHATGHSSAPLRT